MKIHIPSESEILEEYTDEASTAIKLNSIISFENSLKNAVELHGFIVNSFLVEDPNIKHNYALLGDDSFFLSKHEEYTKFYVRIIENAVKQIEVDEEFFATCAYIPYKLFNHFDIGVPQEIIVKTFDLSAYQYRFLNEKINRESQHNYFDEEKYKNIIVDFINGYSSIINYLPLIHKWKECSGDFNLEWRTYSNSYQIIQSHLFTTSHMFLLSVWYRNDLTSSGMLDLLLKWKSYFDFELTDHFYEQLPFCKPYLLNEEWDDVLSSISTYTEEYSHHMLTPKVVFKRIIDNLWNDVILASLSMLLMWNYDNKDNKLILEYFEKLLNGEYYYDDSYSKNHHASIHKNSDNILFSILRFTSLENRDNYISILGKLVSDADMIRERRVISNRSYTPSTIHDFSDLSGYFWLIFIFSIPGKFGDFSNRTLSELHKIKKSNFYYEYLIRLRNDFDRYTRNLESPLTIYKNMYKNNKDISRFTSTFIQHCYNIYCSTTNNIFDSTKKSIMKYLCNIELSGNDIQIINDVLYKSFSNIHTDLLPSKLFNNITYEGKRCLNKYGGRFSYSTPKNNLIDLLKTARETSEINAEKVLENNSLLEKANQIICGNIMGAVYQSQIMKELNTNELIDSILNCDLTDNKTNHIGVLGVTPQQRLNQKLRNLNIYLQKTNEYFEIKKNIVIHKKNISDKNYLYTINNVDFYSNPIFTNLTCFFEADIYGYLSFCKSNRNIFEITVTNLSGCDKVNLNLKFNYEFKFNKCITFYHNIG